MCLPLEYSVKKWACRMRLARYALRSRSLRRLLPQAEKAATKGPSDHGTIEGRILDAVTGLLIANAQVVYWPRNASGGATVSDANGELWLKDMPLDEYRFSTFRLLRLSGLSGRITDDQGNPLPVRLVGQGKIAGRYTQRMGRVLDRIQPSPFRLRRATSMPDGAPLHGPMLRSRPFAEPVFATQAAFPQTPSVAHQR